MGMLWDGGRNSSRAGEREGEEKGGRKERVDGWMDGEEWGTDGRRDGWRDRGMGNGQREARREGCVHGGRWGAYSLSREGRGTGLQTDRQTDACPRAGTTRCPCTHQQVLPVPGWAFRSCSVPARWPHPSGKDGCTPHRGVRGRPVPGGTRLGTPCGTGVSLQHVAPARERGRHAFPVARRSGWMPPVLFICLMHIGSAALTANGTFPICHGWLSPQPGTGPAATAAGQTRGGGNRVPSQPPHAGPPAH